MPLNRSDLQGPQNFGLKYFYCITIIESVSYIALYNINMKKLIIYDRD